MVGKTSPYRYAWAGAIGMAVGMGIGRFVYTPLLPVMMGSLGLTASQVGWIASANYMGYLIGALVAVGRWAQGSERRIILAALVANALLAALMALTTSVAAFIVIRFTAGVASAFVLVFLATIVFSHLASAGRNDLQALHFGGVGMGLATSSIITGWMHLHGGSWTKGWWGSALISLIGFLAVALLLEDGPLSTGNSRHEPPIPWSLGLVKITLAYGLFGFGYVVTATFLIAIVRQQDGSGLLESGVWLLTGLAGIPSLFFWNRVVLRRGHALAFAIGAIVEGAGVVASVSLGGLAGPVLGGFLLGGTFIAITAIGLQAGRLLASSAPRSVLAVMTAAFGVGQILGPVVAGMIADKTGSFFAPSLLAALVLLFSGLIALSAGRDMAVLVAAE